MAYISKNKEIGILIEEVSRAKTEEDFDKLCESLEAIYIIDGEWNSDFRHEYSAISGKINELSQQQECDLDQLVYNIDYLYSRCYDEDKKYIKNLFKLKDHINLEVFRMKYADRQDGNLKSNLREYDNKVKKMESTVGGLSKRINGIQNRLNDSTAQYVSILGIFAAVLLAFISGIVFTNSVLNNIDKVSSYRIIMVVAIIGIIMYNTIYILLKFLERFTYNNNNKVGFGKSWLAVNGILVAIIFVVCFCWWNGTVESRNDKIENRYTIEQSE